MKVKKVLSLALALVMILTMIPAQLILSNANKQGRPSGEIGEAVKYNTDVTLEEDGDYAGLVKVAFQASVKYPETMTTTEQKSIVTLEDIVFVDTTVLEPVDYDGVNSILDTVKSNAGSAPAYSWVVDPEETDIALFGEDVTVIQRNKPVQKQYGLALSALSYNDDQLYIHFVAQQSPSGYVWGVEDQFCTIAYMYFKLADGKELTDVPAAVRNVTEDDLGSDTACRARSFMSENYVSTGPEPNMFSPYMSATYSDAFDPAPQPTTVKVTFNWKAVEEGVVVDKSTGEVEYEPGADLAAPAGSEADYSTDEYDYEFTGWSPEVPATVPETPATQTYTAQYQPKAVNKEALETEYDADKGLVQTDYDEKVPGAWDTFQQALEEAERVLADETASKVDVADALAALEAAMANLTPKTPQASYSITFNWQPGDQSKTDSYNEGDPVQAPDGSEADYVSADGRTKNVFSGWKDDNTGTVYGTAARIPAVAGEASYTAQYAPEDVKVTITFDVNGTKTEVEKIYNDPVTVADAPVVEDYYSDGGDTFNEFTGWDPAAFTNATENKTYTAQFDSKPVYADYTEVDAAIARANAKKAEDEYADKYTEESKTALEDAINAVDRTIPQSQQTTVDQMAGAIEAAIDGLTVKDVTLKFITHEAPEGIEKTYKYGDPVEAADVPEITEYTDGQGFVWSPNGWNKDIPQTAKVDDIFTAQYTKEDTASTADLQQAVNDAIAKRDNGTNWTQASVNNLNDVLDEAAPYLEQGAEFPASQQGAINDLETRVKAAADALTPQGVDQFDVTFNWKTSNLTGDEGTPATDTKSYPNGETANVPDGAEDGYETQDYTYSFLRWEPSIIAVDGANQVYNAVYNDGVQKDAETDDLREALAQAQNKKAEDNYEDKYTEGSREALQNAITNALNVLDTNPKPSQQGTVNTATQAIRDALDNMDKNQFTITFYTHETPQGIDRVLEYGDPIIEPPYSGYSEGDYDYTPNGWLDENDTPVEVPATATQDAKFYANYTQSEKRLADYAKNTAAVDSATAVLATPNADKIYTEDYLQGIDNALQQNVDQGLGRTRQGEVDEATARIENALANPQYINYTISFVDDDDTPIASKNDYHYGDQVTVPADPEKAPTVDKVFTFNAWDPAVENVTKDQQYKATYTSEARPYTVTYNYHGGTSTEPVRYGSTPQNPPTVAPYAEGGFKYTFARWDKEFAPVDGTDATLVYTAVYDKEQMPAVTVTFRYADSLEEYKDGHMTDHPQDVPYGDMPAVPTPKSFVDGNTTYKFVEWDKDVVAATEAATYTAVYEPVTDFVPDMTEINALIARYNQMVKTGKYNKDDLKAVKAYIDEIYDTEFTSQDEVDEMAANLKVLEDSCRRISTTTEKKSSTSKYSSSRTARTGDNATLVVMSIILVSSLGIAVVSLKKRRKNI